MDTEDNSNKAAAASPAQDEDDGLPEEVLTMSNDDLVARTRLIDNDIKVMRSEVLRIQHDLQAQKEKIKENTEKIRVNKTLPYLVSNVIELLDVDPEELGEEDGANVDLDSQRKGKLSMQNTDVSALWNTRPTFQWFKSGLSSYRK